MKQNVLSHPPNQNYLKKWNSAQFKVNYTELEIKDIHETPNDAEFQ